MSASEGPLSLLEELKQRFGVEESAPPYGPAVIVPNSDYRPEWTRLLGQAGFKVFSGEQYGRVAWIIPLKSKLEPKSLFNLNSEPDASQPSQIEETNKGLPALRGCITGRAWTIEEDKQILEMLRQGEADMQIARELAGRLDRSEGAIGSRLKKLRRRRGVSYQPAPATEKPVETSLETKSPPTFEPGRPELRSLLESALLLAEDPKHHAALRLVLEACLRLAAPNQEK